MNQPCHFKTYPVTLEHINIVELQTLKRSLDASKDVLPAQTLAIDKFEASATVGTANVSSLAKLAYWEVHLQVSSLPSLHYLGENDNLLAITPNLL